MNTLEADQLADRRLIAAGLGEVELGDFVAGEVAVVAKVGFDGDAVADVNAGGDMETAVGEAGVAEAIAEGVERLAGEVAVGAALHGVVVEGWELRKRGVEGEWEAAGRVVVAGEGFGDCGAAGFAGIPGFENGGGVLLRPVDSECAAVLQNDDERLAGGGDGFEKLLLHGGQLDAGTVAAGEAFEMHGHLFTFKGGSEADEGDGQVGLSGGSDGLIAERSGGWLPGEVDAGRAGAVEVFEANGVRLRIVEVGGGVKGRAALGGLAGILEDQLAVQVEAEGLVVLAGIAGVDADAEFVGAGSGWSEGSSPANGPVVALQAGYYADDFVPVEVDTAVGAREDGCPGEVGGCEVLAGEAVGGAMRGMECGVLDGESEAIDESGALCVVDD